jgi:hypothetical protein
MYYIKIPSLQSDRREPRRIHVESQHGRDNDPRSLIGAAGIEPLTK